MAMARGWSNIPDSRPGAPVFNRTVTLKDTWAKIVGKQVESKM